MRLAFKLLVIDDNPGSIDGAIRIFGDRLAAVGFALDVRVAEDLTEKGIRNLARREGRDYDLVIVDYNLGRDDTNGATAAARVRGQLPYTDVIFYSSDQSANLLGELANQGVAGVFVARRQELDEALVGVANTIIGKAVDLSHMRGIAMAEVAEMDVLMEEILERVFASGDERFLAKGNETLAKLLESAREGVARLEPMVEERRILDVVLDSRLFSSANKYMAVRRVAKCLPAKPTAALAMLNSYEADVILNRNTLAHAKEEVDGEGVCTLRSIKKGQPPIVIDDAWMTDFRTKLRDQRAALTEICEALAGHLDGLAAAKPKQH